MSNYSGSGCIKASCPLLSCAAAAAAASLLCAELSALTPKGRGGNVRFKVREVRVRPSAPLCSSLGGAAAFKSHSNLFLFTHKGHFNVISLVLKSEHRGLWCVDYHQWRAGTKPCN